MRIGLSIRTFYPRSGGLQAHAERLIRELQAQGHQVTVVTRSVSHSPSYQDYFFFSEFVAEANINGLPVQVLRHARIWNSLMWVISKCVERPKFQAVGIWLFQLLFVRQTIAALRGVEVIHHVGQAHELIGFAAAAAARSLKVPFLVQPTLHPGQWGDSPLDFYLYQQAQRVLVHTEFERTSLERYKLQKPFDVVGNGVEDRADGNAARFRETYNIYGPIILFLGRKEPDKGYPLVKQAFSLIRSTCSDVTLICMGPSPTRTAAPEQEGVLELNFGDEQDKHDALSACTLLCVPSEGESFGLVYMEAGRYAKPVIGRRLPVLVELLGRKAAGLLVGTACGEGNQVQLQPEELRDAILKILNNPEQAKQLGKNAYLVSGEFLWSKVVTQFETAYRCSTDTELQPSCNLSLKYMATLKQKIRDTLAVQLARIIKRFAFDPRYFDLWQTHGYHVKPVSFYSPLPDTQELPDELWSPPSELPGISWNETEQLRLLDLFQKQYSEEYKSLPRSKKSDKPHFHLGNVSFESVDAEVFYCMMRHLHPRKIIEIGSGYSTLLAAEALKVNSDEGHLSKLTAIEPYPPKFLYEELPVPIDLIVRPVQSVPLEHFSALEKNDILFIDSSHVCKIGSDVQYEFLEILPHLAPGVVVHIHDIFLPAEYPKQWVKDWHRFWNEQYLLQAFLCFNPHFEVLWGGSYMHLYHSGKLTAAFDSYDSQQNWPASFWIRRLDPTV